MSKRLPLDVYATSILFCIHKIGYYFLQLYHRLGHNLSLILNSESRTSNFGLVIQKLTTSKASTFTTYSEQSEHPDFGLRTSNLRLHTLYSLLTTKKLTTHKLKKSKASVLISYNKQSERPHSEAS